MSAGVSVVWAFGGARTRPCLNGGIAGFTGVYEPITAKGRLTLEFFGASGAHPANSTNSTTSISPAVFIRALRDALAVAGRLALACCQDVRETKPEEKVEENL